MGDDPRAKTTAAERAEVLRLHAEGVPIRQIAAGVFGDAERFRGRVERILNRAGAPTPPTAETDQLGLDGRTPIEAIRELYERRLAMLRARDEPPSMNELRNLLEVQRRLEAAAMWEQANELTRRDKASD